MLDWRADEFGKLLLLRREFECHTLSSALVQFTFQVPDGSWMYLSPYFFGLSLPMIHLRVSTCSRLHCQSALVALSANFSTSSAIASIAAPLALAYLSANSGFSLSQFITV